MILPDLAAISTAYGFTHFTAPHSSVALIVSVRELHACLLADALDARQEAEVPAAQGGTVRLTYRAAEPGGYRLDMVELTWVRPGQPGQDVESLRGWALTLISVEDFGGHRALLAAALRRGDRPQTPVKVRAWAGQTLVEAGTTSLTLPVPLDQLTRALQAPWDERHWTGGLRGIDLFDMGGEDGGMACWALQVPYQRAGGWSATPSKLILGLSDLRHDPKFADLTSSP